MAKAYELLVTVPTPVQRGTFDVRARTMFGLALWRVQWTIRTGRDQTTFRTRGISRYGEATKRLQSYRATYEHTLRDTQTTTEGARP